jgi:hypothetical protein
VAGVSLSSWSPHGGGQGISPQSKEKDMIILLPLLRHLSVRARMALGWTLTGIGLVIVVIAIAVAAAPGLFIFAIITAWVGVVSLASGSRSRRRERLGFPIG